jgi:tetratricopeptide (TPR) repeat protein
MKTTQTNWKLSVVLLGLLVAAGARAAQPEPTSVLDLVNRSQDAAARDELDAALDLARQATAQDAGYAAGWRQLGAVQLRRRTTPPAGALSVARSLDPQNASLLRDLSAAQWQIGQTNAAIETLAAACRLDPDKPPPGATSPRGTRPPARPKPPSVLPEGVELDPKNANAWRDLGWLLWSFDRRDEAISAFDSAIRNGLKSRRECPSRSSPS